MKLLSDIKLSENELKQQFKTNCVIQKINALMDIILCAQGLNGIMGTALDCPGDGSGCETVPGCGDTGCYEGYSYDYGTASPVDCGGQEDPAILDISSYSIEVI